MSKKNDALASANLARAVADACEAAARAAEAAATIQAAERAAQEARRAAIEAGQTTDPKAARREALQAVRARDLAEAHVRCPLDSPPPTPEDAAEWMLFATSIRTLARIAAEEENAWRNAAYTAELAKRPDAPEAVQEAARAAEAAAYEAAEAAAEGDLDATREAARRSRVAASTASRAADTR